MIGTVSFSFFLLLQILYLVCLVRFPLIGSCSVESLELVPPGWWIGVGVSQTVVYASLGGFASHVFFGSSASESDSLVLLANVLGGAGK